MIVKEITVWGINDPNYPYRRGDFISMKDYPRGLGTAMVPPKYYRIIVAFDNQAQLDRFTDFMQPEYGDEETVDVQDVQVTEELPYDNEGNPILNQKGQHEPVKKFIQTIRKDTRRPINKRRAWRLLMDNVPQGVKDKFASKGFISIGNHPQADYSWAQVKTYLRRKSDEAEADDITTL